MKSKWEDNRVFILVALVAALLAGITSANDADTYLLNPGDQLEISVWNEEALQKTITVLPDGMISFPLVGHLKAAGNSAAAVENTISEKLDSFIAEPEVNVTVSSTRGNVTYVVGKVLKPGPIVMVQTTNVMQALAIAGGINEFAAGEDALLCRARYYLITEDVDAAVTDLRVILRNNPASERALVMLANAYVTSGSQQLADDTFRQVLDINPGNIQAAVPVIKGLLEKQDSDRSEQIIENALAHSPNNEILLSILAQIKLANQDIEGGQKVISKIHASGENPAFGHYLSGRAQQSQARYKQAIASYKKALAMNPDLTRALENLAHCYGRLNQQETLLDFLKSFSKEHSDNLSAFSIMAAVQRQREDYTAAIATLEQGLQRNQHWVGGYSALAVNQMSMGDQDSAIDTYKRGLAVVPNSNLLKMLLASLYENVQAFTDAKALYESVLLTNPDHHAVINNLASLLTDQFESKENISRAVALTERFADSDQPFFIDTYAWALVKSGLPQVAEPLFAKATKLAPNIAIFHYHRAIGFKRLGRIEEAKEALKSAQATVSAQDPLRRAIETELTSL